MPFHSDIVKESKISDNAKHYLMKWQYNNTHICEIRNYYNHFSGLIAFHYFNQLKV